MRCEPTRVIVYDRFYILVHIHDSVYDCRLAGDLSDARAFFLPSASATKLGDVVFQWRDMDTETIAHEAFHIIEELKYRKVRRFSDPHDSEEFYAGRLERVVGKLKKLSPK